MTAAPMERPSAAGRRQRAEVTDHSTTTPESYQTGERRLKRFRIVERMAARRRGELARLAEAWAADGVVPIGSDRVALVAGNALLFLHRQDLRAAHVVDLLGGLIDEAAARWAVARCQREYAEKLLGYPLLPGSVAGEYLALDREERRALDIRTMAAVNERRDEREAAALDQKRARDRVAKRRIRAEAGAKTRTGNVSVERPWEAEGISRRTWYRKRSAERGTKRRSTVLIDCEATNCATAVPDRSCPSLPEIQAVAGR